jgi:hypothetical protein
MRLLEALEKPSDEDILPYALGGSNALVLRADQEINSSLGESIDSDLIHTGLVRLYAARLGIKNRPKAGKPGKPITFNTRGVEQETGRAVKLAFTSESMFAEYYNPVDVDPKSGEIVGVYGMGDQAGRILAQVQKGISSRGKKVLVTGAVQTIANPQIKGGFDVNLFHVLRGLTKIAFLFTARTLGDTFIRSTEAQRFRNSMAARDKSSFSEAALEHYQFEDFAFLSSTTNVQHLLACFRIDDRIVTVVRLFGLPLLSLVCVVRAQPFCLVKP